MNRLLLETLGVGNRTTEREMSLDANTVIILAVLFCSLLLVLCLNSIIRCALRCGTAYTGLKKRELQRIPVAAYGSGEANIAATECAICLGEFVDGERVRVLPPCNHCFHVRCIDKWLLSHTSCPNCRHSLLYARPTPTSAL